MARLPVAKARITGADIKNPARHRGRNDPSAAPLGDPSTFLSPDQAHAWRQFTAEIPWLVAADRAVLEIASILRARFTAMEGDMGSIRSRSIRRSCRSWARPRSTVRARPHSQRMTSQTSSSAMRKVWDHGGKTRHQRGYGREHARLRATLLQDEPLCRHCTEQGRVTPATIADHIVSIAKGGAVHDIANLQPLCRPCHDAKTLAEQGKRQRPTFGTDGWPVDPTHAWSRGKPGGGGKV